MEVPFHFVTYWWSLIILASLLLSSSTPPSLSIGSKCPFYQTTPNPINGNQHQQNFQVGDVMSWLQAPKPSEETPHSIPPCPLLFLVYVQIIKCIWTNCKSICSNCKMYLFKLQMYLFKLKNVFVQIAKNICKSGRCHVLASRRNPLIPFLHMTSLASSDWCCGPYTTTPIYTNVYHHLHTNVYQCTPTFTNIYHHLQTNNATLLVSTVQQIFKFCTELQFAWQWWLQQHILYVLSAAHSVSCIA